jgi:hypothetical protein
MGGISVIDRVHALLDKSNRRSMKYPKRCYIPESVIHDLAREAFRAYAGRRGSILELERDIRAGRMQLFGMQVIPGCVFAVCR